MDNVRSQDWKGFTIETHAFPVHHCALPFEGMDTYVAVVRILRDGHTITDWHFPRYAQRWNSPEEAHRETVEYAIRAINGGCVNEMASAPRFVL